MLFYAIMT